MNWHEDSQMIEKCLDEVNAYFDMLTKSRAIQIGIERKLRTKIKETMELIER